MKCINCAAENRDAAKFCSSCGEPTAPPVNDVPTVEENEQPLTEPITAKALAEPATELATPPAPVPASTLCMFHQDATATGICARCGRSTCQHCARKLGGVNYCLACANRTVPLSTPVMPASVMLGAPVASSASVVPQQTANAFTAGPFTGMTLEHAYEQYFNVNVLAPEMRESLKRHGMKKFPTAVAILLHFVTLGIFTIIYYGLKHSELPKVKADDFSAGKAIGFLFIPFYNIYWEFKFWLRLCDRINFQFRLRNLGSPVPRGLLLATIIVGLIPYVNLISWAILLPISIGFIQSAINKLKDADAMQALQSIPASVYASSPALEPQIQPSNSQAD